MKLAGKAKYSYSTYYFCTVLHWRVPVVYMRKKTAKKEQYSIPFLDLLFFAIFRVISKFSVLSSTETLSRADVSF